MNERRIVRTSDTTQKGKTDWERVRALTDEEIDKAIASDPDAAPIMTDEELARGHIVYPEPKRQISIRLDREVIDWFKRQGPGYRTRINAVLRAFMNLPR